MEIKNSLSRKYDGCDKDGEEDVVLGGGCGGGWRSSSWFEGKRNLFKGFEGEQGVTSFR